MRRTKIVCTIGPATSSPEMIGQLVEAGMNVARLNFSHGAWEEHAGVIASLRQISGRKHAPVAILQDLQGPKIRLGTFRGGRTSLEPGAEFVITVRPVEGTAAQASTTYDHLPRDVTPGDRILLADGAIELRALESTEDRVRCRVVVGGVISDHKGINLPGVSVSARSMTAKDREDLRFGLEHGVDAIAVSFVRGPEDVLEAKKLIAEAGADTPVIAKLEKPEAIQRLAEILEVSDGVMVARGDLGVELPLEEVPLIQKEIIRRARARAIPVITATQMLESMISNPRPTRAEASDVANAILDGTDAVMLSAETAVGRYPIETVRVMSRIAVQAETALPPFAAGAPFERASTFPDVISEAACRAASEIRARAIVAFTQSGFTARLLAKYRPEVPILAFSPLDTVRRRLCLYWGVMPKAIRTIQYTHEMVDEIESLLLAENSVQANDALVIVAGAPLSVPGTTNLIKLHRVEERP
ncbi:MAG TPA: pyruvate kinase [Candidatus Methylomirabilis sp.]|nr:pyruvate kinase [Candidatus Methylomirabilis sp.]